MEPQMQCIIYFTVLPGSRFYTKVVVIPSTVDDTEAAIAFTPDVKHSEGDAAEPDVRSDLLDLRELVQHLESRVCQLAERLDTMEIKQKHSSPQPTEVSNTQEEIASVCTWKLGTPKSDLYSGQGQGEFRTQTGSGELVCKPDDDGWLTILRRVDGSVNFERTWEDYKYSFGHSDGNFWLGNELLHLLTRNRRYKLHVELTDWSGEVKYATYNYFRVASELDKYRLTAHGYNGTAGDSLSFQNGQKFSTIDQDNDPKQGDHCSRSHGGGGGWWYNNCDDSCLTGIYFTGGIVHQDGIEWTKAYNDQRSFMKAVMKIHNI